MRLRNIQPQELAQKPALPSEPSEVSKHCNIYSFSTAGLQNKICVEKSTPVSADFAVE